MAIWWAAPPPVESMNHLLCVMPSDYPSRVRRIADSAKGILMVGCLDESMKVPSAVTACVDRL